MQAGINFKNKDIISKELQHIIILIIIFINRV